MERKEFINKELELRRVHLLGLDYTENQVTQLLKMFEASMIMAMGFQAERMAGESTPQINIGGNVSQTIENF